MEKRQLKQKFYGFSLSLILLFGMSSAVLTDLNAYGQIIENETESTISAIDVDPPQFASKSDISIEANSSDGSIVSFELPIAVDNIGIDSVTCTPPSGSLFPIGITDVICTAVDLEGNSADMTFKVSVVDTTAPLIEQPRNIVVEATSNSDNLISLASPSISDIQNYTLINDAPSSFSIGDTVVTWTAIDESGNSASATQTISVVDTTAPIISEMSDVEQVAFALFTEMELESPIIIEDVDPYPHITNNAPELFPLGETIVTWTVKDFSNNISEKTQNVILTLEPPEILGPSEITREALAHETQFEKINFDIEAKSNLDYILEHDAPESFILGNHTVTWKLTDAIDNQVIHIQQITIADTTPPEIDATIYAHSLSKNQDKGTFRISYDVRDLVDYSPEIFAEINGVPVSNGQFVTLEYSEQEFDYKQKQGVSNLKGSTFILTVSATDESGNTSTVSSNAVFLMPTEEEMLEVEELSIEDLKDLLEKLKTIPPTDIDALGQELQELKFIANLLFDQEKSEIKELKNELKVQLELATDDQKKVLKKEYKDLIKESREEFKVLQSEYKEIFHEYKSITKQMLKEKKDLKSNELERELDKITTRLAQNEDSRQSELNDEKSMEQNRKDLRTNEIFSQILNKVTLMQNIDYPYAKQNFELLHSIKSDALTSKDKQKLIQTILKTSDKSLKTEFKQIIKDVKKDQKELKKSLKLQEKELKKIEKELKKAEKEKMKLTKLQEKELKKIEKELKKIEKEQQKELDKEADKAEKEAKKAQKQLQKELDNEAKKAEKQLKKEAKKAEKEAKKEAKKAEKEAKKEAKKAEKEAKKAEKDSKKD